MSQFPTSMENIALNLIFEWLGESRYNRTLQEYAEIARHLPKLDALCAYVNQRLREIAVAGSPPYEICRFRAGDNSVRYVRFPKSLSITVIRTALVKSGMMELKRNPLIP